VVERDHTVVLNWNRQTISVLKQVRPAAAAAVMMMMMMMMMYRRRLLVNYPQLHYNTAGPLNTARRASHVAMLNKGTAQCTVSSRPVAHMETTCLSATMLAGRCLVSCRAILKYSTGH
jgi:hypothetical protein